VEATTRSRARPCPACAGPGLPRFVLSDRMHRGLDGRFPVSRCQACGTVYLDPLPEEDVQRRHYPDRYLSWAGSDSGPPRPPAGGGGRAAARWLLLRPGPAGGLAAAALARAAGIEAYALARRFERPGRVLDVGCSTGEALDWFARLGWDTAGVEPGPDAAGAARAKGHDVSAEPFLGAQAEGPFDLVLFSHALEHMADPLAALGKARRLLGPGGVVHVATPNAGGLLARLAGRSWWQLDAPRHVLVLTAAGLRALAGRAGLRVASLHTHSVSMGPLVTRRLRASDAFVLEDWAWRQERLHARLAARAFSLAADAAGLGDNLHAVLEPDSTP
jgi:SAM-dependent methyltransferase